MAAALWGGGHIVAGVGVGMHSLPLLIAGYGVLGGCGLGLGYITPVWVRVRVVLFMVTLGLGSGPALALHCAGMQCTTSYRGWAAVRH